MNFDFAFDIISEDYLVKHKKSKQSMERFKQMIERTVNFGNTVKQLNVGDLQIISLRQRYNDSPIQIPVVIFQVTKGKFLIVTPLELYMTIGKSFITRVGHFTKLQGGIKITPSDIAYRVSYVIKDNAISLNDKEKQQISKVVGLCETYYNLRKTLPIIKKAQ